MGCAASAPSKELSTQSRSKIFPEPTKPASLQQKSAAKPQEKALALAAAQSSAESSPEGTRPSPRESSPVPSPGRRGKLEGLDQLILNNREWARDRVRQDPAYFERLCEQQTPEYLWIGCSDSRVPANDIVGLEPGEIFVQRNVGNQAMHTDLNCQTCIEYAVKELKVKTIIVCGHYNCGAVKAALRLPHKTAGLVNCWISDIRECRNQHQKELMHLSPDEQLARLCEYNVMRQVFHVCTTPTVQAAWDQGQALKVYGVCYSLKDGKMRKLAGPLAHDTDLGTPDAESFLTKTLSVKPSRSAATSVGNLTALVDDDDDALMEQVLPSEKSVQMTTLNTAKLANRLRAHASWHDLSAVNKHIEEELAGVRAAAAAAEAAH